MDYQVIKCQNNAVWDEFVSTSPQNNLFCLTHFLDAYNEDYDLLILKKGELVLMGVVIAKNSNGALAENPFIYQGILISNYTESLLPHKKIKKVLELTDFLLTSLESTYGAVELSLHHSLKDLRGFIWHNYHNKSGLQPTLDLNYTGILDLQKVESFEQVLSDARTARRQEYKKCIKHGFTVEDSSDISILDSLHEKTFERQGVRRSRSEIFLANEFAENSLAKGFGRLLVCRDATGVPASASLFLFDSKTGYYLIGANNPEYRRYGAGGYVVLEQIRYCIEQGLSYVDFMGINSPLRGDFKTSFNANPEPYFLFTMGKSV